MIGPSPDWFVGVSALSLLDTGGQWMSTREVDLFPYDAGTEEGTEFSLNNQATSPQGVITSIKRMGKFSNVRMARLTFTRKSVNNAPSFTSGTSFEADENQTAAGTVVATDPDPGDAVTYSITGGADAAKFEIDGTTGVMTFQIPPNYESPGDRPSTDPVNGAANNEYIVTVTATGGASDRALTSEQTITVTVLNVDEPGVVSFWKSGSTLRVRLSDPDRGRTGTSWQWARSSDRDSGWVDIADATSGHYTPSDDDEGMYLRATASYDDRHGPGKMASGISSSQIRPPDIEVTTVVSNLTIPWDIAFAPDGTMLFTERSGVLSARSPDGTVQTVTADFVDLYAQLETGLMGIVVDPNFASNRRLYTCQGHTGPEIQVIAWTINADYTTATRVADPLVGGLPRTALTAAAGYASDRRTTSGLPPATRGRERPRRTWPRWAARSFGSMHRLATARRTTRSLPRPVSTPTATGTPRAWRSAPAQPRCGRWSMDRVRTTRSTCLHAAATTAGIRSPATTTALR